MAENSNVSLKLFSVGVKVMFKMIHTPENKRSSCSVSKHLGGSKGDFSYKNFFTVVSCKKLDKINKTITDPHPLQFRSSEMLFTHLQIQMLEPSIMNESFVNKTCVGVLPLVGLWSPESFLSASEGLLL